MELTQNLPNDFLQTWNEALLFQQVQHCLTKVYNNMSMLLHVEEYLFVPYAKEFKHDLYEAIKPLDDWIKKVEPIIRDKLQKYK